jgi:D-alanine-D-alanine ligase
VVVKPDAEDASLGIDQSSVVAGADGLAGPVGRLRARYGGRVLIEAYLPGPEFNVGVLALGEPAALPVAEVVFNPGPGDWPILTYAAKWDVGSSEDLASPIRCPARIDGALAVELGRLAVAAFRATHCRDYARVDFRLDGRGRPMILEVNPNPDLGPGAGWARALQASGRDYGATLTALVGQAVARGSAPGLGA